MTGLEVGWVGDFLGEARCKGDELVNLEAGYRGRGLVEERVGLNSGEFSRGGFVAGEGAEMADYRRDSLEMGDDDGGGNIWWDGDGDCVLALDSHCSSGWRMPRKTCAGFEGALLGEVRVSRDWEVLVVDLMVVDLFVVEPHVRKQGRDELRVRRGEGPRVFENDSGCAMRLAQKREIEGFERRRVRDCVQGLCG